MCCAGFAHACLSCFFFFFHRYLAPAFKAFRSIYLRTGITAIDDCLLFLNLLVPTFLTSFTLLMIFVFLPHIKATNEDIQIKRAIVRERGGGRGESGVRE